MRYRQSGRKHDRHEDDYAYRELVEPHSGFAIAVRDRFSRAKESNEVGHNWSLEDLSDGRKDRKLL